MIEERETDTWHFATYFKGTRHMGAHRLGRHFFVIERLNSDNEIPLLDDGFLGLELYEGTPPAVAEELLGLLNKHVEYLTYTGPTRPEWEDRPGRSQRNEGQVGTA